MTTESVTDFMKSPLVTWVKNFSEENKELEYHHLCNGLFLHEVMLQIDPRPAYKDISQAVDDVVIRICNLDTVVRNVRAFYEEALGQLVVAKLPDVIGVSKEPKTENSLENIKELLLLILGCAVQCDKKEQFIEQIKCLDLLSQHALVECIQLVTDNPETVWTQEWNDLSAFPEDQQEPTFRLLVHHVRRIVKERDQLWHAVNMLVVERDGNGKCMTPRGGSPGSLTDNYHLGVELADTKAKLRRMKQELEEKNEAVVELKEELEQNKILVNKLRQESLDLLQDARAAKSYRDELDILRERASKVDKLENEIQRYKDKLNELEFYKSRVEELREDNRILVETKEMLEEQLEHSRKRTDQILELENELLKYKARVNELLLEKDVDRNRIQEVIDENATLQMSAKQSMNESANLLVEIDKLRSNVSSGVGNSLSEQLNKDTQLRLRKLELENQKLLSIIDNLKESSFYESNEKILELDKENKRLSLKVLQLQDLRSKEFQRCLDAEQRQQELMEEIKKLQDTLETVKMNGDRQQKELQREKEQLFEQVETLRQRNQKSNDARMKDIETENKKLVENTQEMKGQISRLEFDKLQLEKSLKRLKDNAERLSEVENQKMEVDRENSDLHKAIAAFKMTCDKYEKLEQDHIELQAECKKLKKLLENMKTICSKVDRLEQENVKFLVENQKLNKTLESMKVSSQKLLEMEQEKDDLIQSNQLLKKNLEALKFDRSRFEQMELDLISQNNDNTKLQKSVESSQKKMDEIENENQALELENQKLQKNIETLKVSNRRLNNLERENTDLEAENHKLDKEKKSLEKEVARLKQATEIKDSTIDECSSKISTLERESKRLKKDLENTSHLSSRVKELEKENREVIQQSMIDKKTLITLREDLVNEKIKTQQLTNELDKLNSELQKIGLKKEKLLFAEHAQDEDRYKALENMMEEALKKSLEIKEEKIHALESRLEESAVRNTQLKEELNKIRQMYEALQQRLDEEMRSSSHSEKSDESDGISNLTSEILRLKDHLVEVERMNATLLEENRNLKATLNNCREQLSALQQQVLGLQHQAASLTEQNGTLQALNAKLQVENTTLQSQNTSLSTQFSSLSAQRASLEADREQLLHHQEELQSAHEQLVSDHEALQKLHEQLSSDYETLRNELGTQKTSQKCLKQEYKNLKEKYQAVVAAQEMVESQQEALDKERELLKAESKTLINLRAEHSRLTEDFRVLHTTNEKLKIEYKNLQSEYKTLKTEHNSLKLKNTELQGEIADSRDQVNSLDVEVSKLHSKCEMLQHMNTALDQDRRSLMSQVTTLLTQYHELLTQTLEDKDHFHEEEKSFADKLNNLRRQKEKLEEKIMEQYRKMENYSPKKKGFGANLVRKVRRAGTELMSRVPRSARSKDREKERSRRNLDSNETIDGLDDVSLGSGSVSNESPDSGSDASTLRKTSKDDDMQCSQSFAEYLDQNGQSCIHRHLAFSTTALHTRKSTSPSLSMFDDHERVFRGSFSSEDIASIRADSRNSDGQLGDVESMSSSIVSGQTKSSALQTSGDEVTSNRISLTTPGTRRAVYYPDPDEHDTIPTRDVGPDNDTSASKKSLSEAHNYKLNNVFNGHDLKPTISPYTVRRSDEISKSSSLSVTPLHQSLYATTSRCYPPTSSLFSSQKSLKSSVSNCIRSETVSQEILSSNKSEVSTVPQLNTSEDKSLLDISIGNQSSRKSCLITTDTSTSEVIGSPRNRQSCLYPDSSLSNESATRNNNLSSCRRPNVLPVTNSSAKPLPEKSNLDNTTNSEANVTEDKPPDNSIWYEYGCV